MPREGVFARVLKGGRISVGDEMRIWRMTGKEKASRAVINCRR